MVNRGRRRCVGEFSGKTLARDRGIFDKTDKLYTVVVLG